jgi:hypothetical protein
VVVSLTESLLQMFCLFPSVASAGPRPDLLVFRLSLLRMLSPVGLCMECEALLSGTALAWWCSKHTCSIPSLLDCAGSAFAVAMPVP